MRVAFVDQAGGKPGGAQESLALLLKHLPSDIEPRIFVFEDGEFAQRMRDCGFPTHVVHVSDRLRSVTRERPTSMAFAELPQVITTLSEAFRKHRVNMVHTNTVKAHFLASPAARVRGIPTVMHLRDMIEGPGRTALRAFALMCSRERIAISRALASWYQIPATTIVSNPVELPAYDLLPTRAQARAQLGIPVDEKPLIGIVGRINRWKGHDRFLKIAAKVNSQFPIRCAIVGEARFRDANFVPELRQLASDLGIADRTTFVPWLRDPNVAYAALDVHCNCSEREPFGRSIVEAAAAGVPTIAFDDGGAEDIIRDGLDGTIVPSGDNSSFAAALLRYLRDPQLRFAAGVEARNGSRRFGAVEHGNRVAEILRRSAR